MGNKKLVKVESTIEDAFSLGRDEMESLRDEMQEWRENMEGAGTGLENTEKFSVISETADALETGLCEIESIEIPETLHGWPVEYTYVRPYGRKPMSRADRSSMAHSALESVCGVLEAIVEGIDEHREGVIEGNRSPKDDEMAILEADQIAGLDDEALIDLDDKIKEIQSGIENAMSELENVEFPGMFY